MAIHGHLKLTHCRTSRRRMYDFLLVLNSNLTSDFKFHSHRYKEQILKITVSTRNVFN